MRTGRRRGNDAAGDALPYKLVFDERGVGIAKLSSPLLDPSMHEGGVLRVSIGDSATGEHGRADVLAIDSFQVGSLVDYLANQAAIREALTKAVDEHLAAGGKRRRKVGRGTAVWRTVKVSFALFSPRVVHTPESIQALRRLLPGMTDEAFATKRDAAERARSNFELFLSGPWPDEHERWADFRDGKLVSLYTHG